MEKIKSLSVLTKTKKTHNNFAAFQLWLDHLMQQITNNKQRHFQRVNYHYLSQKDYKTLLYRPIVPKQYCCFIKMEAKHSDIE